MYLDQKGMITKTEPKEKEIQAAYNLSHMFHDDYDYVVWQCCGVGKRWENESFLSIN